MERGGNSQEWPQCYPEWAFSRTCSNSANGGLHRSYAEGVLHQFDPPRAFSASGAVALGDAMDSRFPDPKETIMRPYVDWGHASACQLKQVLADSGGGTMGLTNYVGEVLGQCGICRAVDGAPHFRIAGTSTASALNGKLQADLPRPDGAIALRAMDAFSEYSTARAPSEPSGGKGRFLRLAGCNFGRVEVHPNGRRR